MNDLGPQESEPPTCGSRLANALFLIGRNRRGHWVVQDQRGLCGGLFVNRAEALKFALLENGNKPQAVIMVPGVLELNMHARAAHQARPRTQALDFQQAA